ncbi:MAG TPA: hypothetical protein PLY76_05630, partial [Flavobacteriales bacterium]|nr:hypothetical protein [Flavobacteriales bacterium]
MLAGLQPAVVKPMHGTGLKARQQTGNGTAMRRLDAKDNYAEGTAHAPAKIRWCFFHRPQMVSEHGARLCKEDAFALLDRHGVQLVLARFGDAHVGKVADA